MSNCTIRESLVVKNATWSGCGFPEPNQDTSIIVVTAVVLSLQTIVFGLRMLCRAVRIAPWGWDDTTIVVAFVSACSSSTPGCFQPYETDMISPTSRFSPLALQPPRSSRGMPALAETYGHFSRTRLRGSWRFSTSLSQYTLAFSPSSRSPSVSCTCGSSRALDFAWSSGLHKLSTLPCLSPFRSSMVSNVDLSVSSGRAGMARKRGSA